MMMMMMMMLRELACNPANDRAQAVPITAFVAVLCPLLGSSAACSRRTGGPTCERVPHRHFDPDPTPISLYDYELNQSRTKYQIVLNKTDLVFPVDVARRAMQIEEVIDAKISSAFTFKPDDGELKIWSSGAGIRTLRTVLC